MTNRSPKLAAARNALNLPTDADRLTFALDLMHEIIANTRASEAAAWTRFDALAAEHMALKEERDALRARLDEVVREKEEATRLMSEGAPR